MISQVEMEKRNLESSLLFMQQEHSNTLKALHEEIGGLQKRCRELTFELTMQDITNAEAENHAEKNAKIKELANLLSEQEIKYKQLEANVDSKNTIIAEFKAQLRNNEKKFMEELKKKNQQVLALKVELDNKGGTIAYLTTEMHKFKVLHRSTDKFEELPTSPPPPSSQIARRRPRRLQSASDIESRPVTARGSMPRPDAEVFLAKTVTPAVEMEPEGVTVKPTPPVLPPITGGDDIHRKSLDRRQKLLRRRVDMKSQPEYTKLAVDKLASNSNTWVHEPNTTTK